ncbi:hypothetical protein SGP16002_42230 [Shigella flexneri]|nr:hypothetical protein SGP16002_42230 [Shigella flexneri]
MEGWWGGAEKRAEGKRRSHKGEDKGRVERKGKRKEGKKLEV